MLVERFRGVLLVTVRPILRTVGGRWGGSKMKGMAESLFESDLLFLLEVVDAAETSVLNRWPW